MKLIAFCIKNYRSIVNTQWKQLSPDNITIVISQNESGKTSILEALNSFYNGRITEDILRSDESIPEISCSFIDLINTIDNIPKDKELPEGLIDKLKSKKRINLKRTWHDTNDFKSIIDFEESEILKLFELDIQKRQNIKNEVKKRKETYITKHKILEELLTEYGDNIILKQNELEECDSLLKPLLDNNNQNKENKINSTSEIDNLHNKKNDIEKEISTLKNKLEKNHNKIEDLKNDFLEVKRIIEEEKEYNSIENSIKLLKKDIESNEINIKQSKIPNKKSELQKELHINKEKLSGLLQKIEKQKEKITKSYFVAEQVFLGIPYEKVIENYKTNGIIEPNYYTSKELAVYFFNNIPQFYFIEDFYNLLPNQIDLDDIENMRNETKGYVASKNFLTVAEIDISLFRNTSNKRILEQKIENINKTITREFQEFWSQKVGKLNKIEIEFNLKHHSSDKKDKSGKPYLVFWIKDGAEKLYPVQRSKGVRWFISFYLQLKAAAIESKDKGLLMLIDEPGNSLHARAKEDILKVLEDIKEKITVIYTSHSPYLLNIHTVYRVLAVQRDNETDLKSDTKILTSHELGAASSDTLSPLYTLMGANFSEQNAISHNNNIILEEISAFYYLKAFLLLHSINKKYFLLPATGVSNIPQLANLLLGWGLNFGVVVDDDKAGRIAYNYIKDKIFNNDEMAIKRVIKLKEMKGIEDHFSQEDFKKHVHIKYTINKNKPISESLKEGKISKGLLALNFYLSVKSNKITKDDFQKITLEKIKNTVERICNLEIE